MCNLKSKVMPSLGPDGLREPGFKPETIKKQMYEIHERTVSKY